MARRRFRTTLLPTFPSLALALAIGCAGTDPVDGNNQFTTTNGGDMGTDGGTADEIGTEAGTDDATTDMGDGDGDGDPSDSSTGDGDGDPTTADTTDDATTDTGECETPPDLIGSSCGQSSGQKGPVVIGESIVDLPVGGISGLDNGLGNGAEDWYQFEFPIDPANPRPTAGTPTITLALNENSDYRFEVYRDCGAEAYGQGLAADFGSNAPPLDEWSFNDIDPGGVEQLEYMELVPWPSTVWVRVFRFQNDGDCTGYQLLVTRP